MWHGLRVFVVNKTQAIFFSPGPHLQQTQHHPNPALPVQEVTNILIQMNILSSSRVKIVSTPKTKVHPCPVHSSSTWLSEWAFWKIAPQFCVKILYACPLSFRHEIWAGEPMTKPLGLSSPTSHTWGPHTAVLNPATTSLCCGVPLPSCPALSLLS